MFVGLSTKVHTFPSKFPSSWMILPFSTFPLPPLLQRTNLMHRTSSLSTANNWWPPRPLGTPTNCHPSAMIIGTPLDNGKSIDQFRVFVGAGGDASPWAVTSTIFIIKKSPDVISPCYQLLHKKLVLIKSTMKDWFTCDLEYTVPTEGDYYIGYEGPMRFMTLTQPIHLPEHPIHVHVRTPIALAAATGRTHQPGTLFMNAPLASWVQLGKSMIWDSDVGGTTELQVRYVSGHSRKFISTNPVPSSSAYNPDVFAPTNATDVLRSLQAPQSTAIPDSSRISVHTAQILDLITCPCCNRFIIQPENAILTTCCGFFMCKTCVLTRSPSLSECPQCESPFQIASHVHRILIGIFDSLKIKCFHSSNGCPLEISAKDLQLHESSCDYDFRGCSFCKEPILQRDLQAHLETCAARLVNCPKCYRKVRKVVLDTGAHFHTCPSHGVKCPQCSQTITRSALGDHILTTCPKSSKAKQKSKNSTPLESLSGTNETTEILTSVLSNL